MKWRRIKERDDMKKLIFGYLYTLIVLLSFPVLAQELRVGLAELDYPPFYFEKNGQYNGAALEISKKVAKNLGHDLVFVRAPWRRIQSYLRSGNVDMMILYFRTPEREQDVIYVAVPHINESSDLFVLHNSDIKFEGSLHGLTSYKFGNIRGYSHGTEYDNAKQISKHTFSNEEQLIEGLVNGRVDIGVGNKPVVLRHAKNLKLVDKIRFLSPSLHIGENYIVFSKARKDAQELADKFSSQLKTFMKTDEYRTILQKYHFDGF